MMGIEEEPEISEDIKTIKELEISEDVKTNKRRRRVINLGTDSIVLDEQYKRTLLCVAKPSYILGLGPKASRSDYLKGLPNILRELLRQRNWREASRVLSVLMLGTMKDGSPMMNRLKYEAQIQILSHLQPKKNKKAEEIGRVYDTWIGKIGKQHKEERLLVWFEQICHFIEHGMDVDAYSAAISMMQNRDLGSLPRTNLFIGITFYKMWCSKFVKELQPEDADSEESISGISEARSNSPVEYPVGDESVYTMESEGSARNDSMSSVMNNKNVSHMSISDSGTKLDTKVKLESLQHYNPSRIYAESEESDVSVQDEAARSYDPTLIRILGDMDPWLLPMKPPEDPDCYVKMVNDSYYKEAVKHLRLTLQSPIHVSLAALHPLVQMLLIGGHVDEAMIVVEKMCNNVHDIKPFRIKALMMEKFRSNSDTLGKCYEDILKIDPNCGTTLKKLIAMSIEADGYSKESLIEMIALHVEVSYPEPEIWKELASCFIYFFEFDEDRMSVCLGGSGEERNQQTYSVRFNPTPKMFTDASWTLRAKLWLYRHFSPEMLETEIENGDLEMMSYKAACASHIYGREFGYVTKVYGLLEQNTSNRDLFIFLRTHRRNWNRIYNLD